MDKRETAARETGRPNPLMLAFAVTCLAVLFAVMLVIPVLRHGFSIGFPALDDLAHYSFGLLVVMSIAASIIAGRHVQVSFKADSDRPERSVRRGKLAYVMFCFAFLVIAWFVFPDLVASWRILEGSRETDGLGGYFLVKTGLFVMAVTIVFTLGARLVLQLRMRGSVDGPDYRK